MHDEELERANALISSGTALSLAPSRFLGHYVVAQLASRHGLSVHLAASPAGGLTAMIALPGVLVGMKDLPAAAVPDTAASLFETPAPDGERPPLLPRRESAADAAPISFRDSSSPAPAPTAPGSVGPDRAGSDLHVVTSLEETVERDDATSEFPDVDWQQEFDAVDAVAPSDGADTVIPLFESRPDDEPDPAPTLEGGTAAPESAAGPEAPVTIEPVPAPEPPAPAARPRLGLGTFADLRGATGPTAPAPTPAAPEAPAVVPAPAAAAPEQVQADLDRPSTVAPDRRASFADVAQAVEVATARPVTEPASPFSEDLLPQRLPKRGRRNSKLETPWVRQRPAASPPAAPAAGPTPTRDGASPGPLPSRAAEPPVTTMAAAPTNGTSVTEPSNAPASPAGGGERFAFFAAFRAAAEQAREEAGIDDGRGH